MQPLDIQEKSSYNDPNCIGQFVTILSVNKTRDFRDGRFALIFLWDGCVLRPFFFFEVRS